MVPPYFLWLPLIFYGTPLPLIFNGYPVIFYGYILLFMVTLFCPNIPSRPDLFLILPPVIVPRMDVFFSDGVPCGVPGFMLPRWNFIVKILVPHGQKYPLITAAAPDMLSKDDRSSKGISPGGRNPLLNFSITSTESCKQRERGDNYDYSWH